MLKLIGEFVISNSQIIVPVIIIALAVVFIFRGVYKTANLIISLLMLVVALDGIGFPVSELFSYLYSGIVQVFERLPVLVELARGTMK